jgi:hypothetical protein
MVTTATAAAEEPERRTAALLRLERAGVHSVHGCRGAGEPSTAQTMPIDLLEWIADLVENPEASTDALPDAPASARPSQRRRRRRPQA